MHECLCINWITTVTLYDDKARPIYSHSKNEYLQTEDISNIKLEDFLGLTLETHNKHSAYGDTTIIVDKFTYNEHNQSLVKHTQNINNQGEELIVFNEYDELGQLIEKRVGGGDVANASNTLQNINFNYNIRGWLTDINDVLNPNPDKLFAFNIRYNDLPDGSNTQALFNGNISETHWRTQNTSSDIRSYSYEYDALNRLNSANYLTPHAMIGDLDGEQEDFFEGDINYDKNGNILSLKRKGATTSKTIDLIDDLDYDYFSTSNQLSRVSDTADDNGFKDGNTSGNDYTYDANGNMIEDKNKDIVNIEYNHLNLPKKVEFATQSMTGKYIEYVYDATGVKLAKRVQQDGLALINFTYYSGAFIYAASNSSPDVNLKFISQPEGYIEPDNQGGFDYVYQFKDHLGNIRLSYKDNSGTLEIVEENNYYPFGLKHKGYNYVVNGTAHPYGYNGFEEQEEFGLNWIDYGARNYMPDLGRWFNVDPLAEDYFEKTPYMYAGNNPTMFVDYDGRDFGVYIDHDKNTITIKSHYIVTSDDSNLMNEIASYWNGQSGNFVYSIGEGVEAESYSINFEVTVEVDDSATPSEGSDFLTAGYERAQESRDNNPTNNDINSLVTSSDHISLKRNENYQGLTGGNDAVVRKNAKSRVNTGKHEVGHNFGMSHTSGLMNDSGGISVSSRSVGETLSRVGLGTGNYGDNTGDGAIGSINRVNGSAPQNFTAGSVVTQKKFNRRKNRAVRKAQRNAKKG